ncbi:hypothetical protein Rsub_02029 [Raphidocelis subcapitata]|uniref:CARDB domain-containing protein n=1 Tax=Raphidocelis subcapitata TaxID=307507 RepID=A0A2V0NWZ7_9CHLO|nr:hypothetical protein Rsub_02029 [Raphidocelis subcapitata]|eukprot:GBF89457.1 hypothetical protein Rsub_02029 [Raphidocelis subcapitata]
MAVLQCAGPILAALLLLACPHRAGAQTHPPPPPDGLEVLDINLHARVTPEAFVVPSRPAPGEKFTWTLTFQSLANATRDSILVSFWADGSLPSCGSPANRTLTLKNVKPREVRAVTATLTAPAGEGLFQAWAYFDSDCAYTTNGPKVGLYYAANSTQIWDVAPLRAPTNPTGVPVISRAPVSAPTSPLLPVVGQPFELQVDFKSIGQLPSPEGLKVGLWYRYVSIGDWKCGMQPDVVFTLPKSLRPGKTTTVAVQLTTPEPEGNANQLWFAVDPFCEQAQHARAMLGDWYTLYDSSYAPMPMLWGAGRKNRGDLSFKLSPASPKAGSTAKAKLKVTNLGNAPGVVGQVKVWVVRNDYDTPLKVPGSRCAYTGEAASAAFNGTTVEPGKSKRVTVPGVPIPSAPGSYYLFAEFDTACANPYSLATTVYPVYDAPPMAVFTVK